MTVSSTTRGPVRPRTGRLSGVAIPVAIVMAGTALSLFRLPATAQDTLWAEDGGIFLNGALRNRSLSQIFAPYQGYLHVIPRFAAWFAVTFLPPNSYALAFTALSCLAVGVVAALIWHCSSALSRNTYVRLAWAAIPVLVAAGPRETLGNFANLHWYLLCLMPWLLIKRPASVRENVLLTLATLFSAFTEIQTALFIPLFLFRFKDRAFWPPRLALLVGVACQIITDLVFPRSAPTDPSVNWWSVIEGWFLNSSSAIVYGSSQQIILTVTRFGWVPVALAAVPFLTAFVMALVRGSRMERLMACVFLLASIGVWSAAQAMNFQPYFDYARFNATQWQSFFLSRYTLAPSMFLLDLAPLVAVVATRISGVALPAILGAFAVVLAVYFFPPTVGRDHGPTWSTGVQTARSECRDTPAATVERVPIAPTGWTYDKVLLPCDMLR
ncbi:hypothetical protein [Sinomonas humi]|uniref:Uncharacterized protein n=1 Tax=Sinomonas humi TaxID=1338436 RepID=A0A0B2AFQ3_9MICC|nr:hypothetical protein [Sinomonas humi]KHL00640.1 hypothetical protein LK10_19080 [Sinomonas humi]